MNSLNYQDKNTNIAQRIAQISPVEQPIAILTQMSLEAMLMEVSCYPSPGLVSRIHAGAHKDMDFFTFLKSTSALCASMQHFAHAGWHSQAYGVTLLEILREIGKEAENEMFRATQGVNTQKGIIFLLGITLAATAGVWRKIKKCPNCSTLICDQIRIICTNLVERELLPLKKMSCKRSFTAGERFYLQHGMAGIRGEVEHGLPTVEGVGLPSLEQALKAGLTINDAMVHALIAIMTKTADTTVFHRKGMRGLNYVQKSAKRIIDLGGMLTETGKKEILKFDQSLCKKGISPGGSADLLVITYFIYNIIRYQKN